MTQIKDSWRTKGYVDEKISEGIDLPNAIRELCNQKNAVILAHYYTLAPVQDVAHFIGDSLALAQQAARTSADIIVMCGVHFMGETCKLLCPEKKVLIPDANAGCSLAESCPSDAFADFVKAHPAHTVISYVNTSAATKALTDMVVTSSNARAVVESFPKDEKIIFAPDRNLGSYLNALTGREMLLWDGACHVHERFSVAGLQALKTEFPTAKILAHPECKAPVLALADFVGSTAALLRFAVEQPDSTFIVATESGILHEMQRQAPSKNFIPVPPEQSEGTSCSCNECAFMRLNTLQKIYNCLRFEFPEVTVDPVLAERAVLPVTRMLDLSEKLGI